MDASCPRLAPRDKPRGATATPVPPRRRRPYLGTIAVPIACLAIFCFASIERFPRPDAPHVSVSASVETPTERAQQRPKQVIDRIADEKALPEHDVNATCAEFGRRNGPDAHRTCLQVEQRNYDFLRVVWPSLTDRTRAFCMRMHDTLVAKVSMRYGVLGECVTNLLPNDRLDQQGPFRRW